MVEGIKNRGAVGNGLKAGEGFYFRAATGGAGSDGISPENLRAAIVEIRLADLEKDAEAIADIFGQASVIEHLAGVAPAVTTRNIQRFKKKLPELMPGVNVDPNEIIIATKKEVGDYLRLKDPSKAKVLIAESVGPNPKVLGTITVEKPGGTITIVSVSKLAVLEEARGQGVGLRLIKAATEVGLRRVEDGGWGYSGASAGIIQVAGSEKPQRLFQQNMYRVQATRPNGCLSWSNEEGKFVLRDVVLVNLDGVNYKPDPQGFPKKAV